MTFIQLLPQMQDVHIHHIRSGMKIKIPHMLQYFLPGADLIRPLGQIEQQLIFPLGQMNKLTAPHNLAA